MQKIQKLLTNSILSDDKNKFLYFYNTISFKLYTITYYYYYK